MKPIKFIESGIKCLGKISFWKVWLGNAYRFRVRRRSQIEFLKNILRSLSIKYVLFVKNTFNVGFGMEIVGSEPRPPNITFYITLAYCICCSWHHRSQLWNSLCKSSIIKIETTFASHKVLDLVLDRGTIKNHSKNFSFLRSFFSSYDLKNWRTQNINLNVFLHDAHFSSHNK